MTITESPEKQKEEYQKLLEHQIELKACRENPHYFFQKYVMIQDSVRRRAIHWSPFPYLVKLLDNFGNYNDIVILKARQLGISWLVCGYALWNALFHDNVRVLMFSQKQDDAMKLVGGGEAGAPGKVKFVYNHLPDWMKLTIGRDTGQLVDFRENGSAIEAFPSTEEAGRGTDATLVIRDELERHPYAMANLASIGPTIDAGGKLIDLSSPLKTIAIERSHFKTRYIDAQQKKNNAYPIFLSRELKKYYLDFIGKDYEEWFAETEKRYEPWVVEQEYPLTEAEALSSLESVKFFSQNALDSMLLDLLEPMRCDEVPDFGGIVKVYKPPVIGERYVIYTDPSDGVNDPFHTVVMKRSTGEGVCEATGKVKADICAKIHDTLVYAYNKADNSYEANALAGGKFAETINNLGTPNQLGRHDNEGRPIKDRLGLYVTPPMKKLILFGLEEAVRRKAITTHRRETISQMNDFIIPEGKEPQAISGVHDDAVMAWAGCVQISKWIPSGTFSIKSVKYKD